MVLGGKCVRREGQLVVSNAADGVSEIKTER